MHICVYAHLSLSLYIYMCIYTIIIILIGETLMFYDLCAHRAARHGTHPELGKGQIGSALLGSLQMLCLLTEALFFGAPVDLLLYSKTCQGVPFSSICQNPLLLPRPH